MTIHVHMVRSSMLDFECLSPQVYGRPSLGCLAKFSLKRPFNFTDSSPIRATNFEFPRSMWMSPARICISSLRARCQRSSVVPVAVQSSVIVPVLRCARWCYHIMVLVSRHGAAWNVSLSLLFSVGDSVSKCIQTQHSSEVWTDMTKLV